MANPQNDGQETWPVVFFAIIALVIVAIVVLWIYIAGMKDAKDLTAIAAVFTSLIGTVVGLMVGTHVGASGKATLRNERKASEDSLRTETKKANLAMGILTDEQRKEVHTEMQR